jgi:hypothetical protein
MIVLAATGLLLSTTLLGCAKPPAVAPPPEVVVRTVRETPPAELLRCPAAVPGLPTDGGASIPADWRAGIRRMAKSRGDLFDQVSRLIQFHTGEACGAGG